MEDVGGEKGDPGGGEQGKARGDGLVAGEEGNTLVDGGGEAGLGKGGRATWWLVRGRWPCWGKRRGRGRGGVFAEEGGGEVKDAGLAGAGVVSEDYVFARAVTGEIERGGGGGDIFHALTLAAYYQQSR